MGRIDPIGKHIGLALDGISLEKAVNLARSVDGEVAILKANDLAADEGSKTVVRSLAPFVRGGGTWMDFKTCDTNSTMGNTMDKIGENGARIASVHLFNTQAALQKALEHTEEHNLVLTGITMLSSFTKKEAEDLYNRKFEAIVPWLAQRAIDLGFKSIVCSATQLGDLIELGFFTKGIVPIIPGTRSTTTPKPDKDKLNFQAQTDTTENTFRLLAMNKIEGAVVIGSEVTSHTYKLPKLLEIKASIRDALEQEGLVISDKIPLLE